MRVKTNPSALISSAVIVGVLSLTVMGNGAQGKSAGTLDSFVVEALRGALPYIAVFVGGHFLLRRQNIGRRWAYAGLGAVAALLAVGALIPPWAWATISRNGNLSLLIGVVTLTGAILGFIYNWRAGLEADGDEPAELARAVGDSPQPGAERIVPDWSVAEGPVAAGGQEYFSGPLQVRTSAPLAFVAGLTSAGLFGGARYVIQVGQEMVMQLASPAPPSMSQAFGLSAQSALLTILIMGLVAPIPIAILTFLGHLAARGLKKSSYLAYGLIGLTAPVMLCLLGGIIGVIWGLQATIPVVIAMCLYRNMAGLEPVPVKEDIFVNERRNLVGAAHPRREFGRLVKS